MSNISASTLNDEWLQKKYLLTFKFSTQPNREGLYPLYLETDYGFMK